MKRIQKLDDVRNSNLALCNLNINSTFYYSYLNNLESGNEIMDFCEHIWDKEVDKIIDHCKEFGISIITISDTSTQLLDTLALFESKGCKIGNLTKTKTKFIDFKTGKNETRNAIKVFIG